MASLSYNEDLGYAGEYSPGDGVGEFNATRFLIEQILAGAAIATLVKVKACTNNGGLTEVGTVDIIPLVNQLDGYGKPIEHGTIYKCPYLRIQGGKNAVIIDPEPGDIGIAVFAHNDISNIIKTKAQGNPGSRRRNDWADALYLGGVLNVVPEQFVRFAQDGIKITSPTKVQLNAPTVEVNAPNVTINASSGFTVNSPSSSFSGSLGVGGRTSTGQLSIGGSEYMDHHHLYSGTPTTGVQ